MKPYLHKIGAVFYILWGLLHIIGGVALLQTLSSEGVKGVLATLGSAVPTTELPVISGGVTGAVLAFFAFNWVWIGLLVLVAAVRLNWYNSKIGYWLNLAVAGAADLGLIVMLLAPGYMAISDGWAGPLLWLLAIIFSTTGLLNRNSQQTGQVMSKEQSLLPGSRL